jgi:hypothetical protein
LQIELSNTTFLVPERKAIGQGKALIEQASRIKNV